MLEAVYLIRLRHGSPEVVAHIVRGEMVDPSECCFRDSMIFESPKGKYEGLNKLIAVGQGERRPEGVVIDVFEMILTLVSSIIFP